MSSSSALKTFSLTNDVKELSPLDEIFKFDVEANKRLLRDAPWARECVSPFEFSSLGRWGVDQMWCGVIARITSSRARSQPLL